MQNAEKWATLPRDTVCTLPLVVHNPLGAQEGRMGRRPFFIGEHEGRVFFGNTHGDEFAFAALRDGGSQLLL